MKKLATEYALLGDQSLSMDIVNDAETRYGSKKIDSIAVKSAMANYNKALSIYPACVEALIGKGNLLKKIGESDEAEKCYKKAIKEEPKNVSLLTIYGKFLYDDGNEVDALKIMKKAIK